MKNWKGILFVCLFAAFFVAPACADIWDDDVPAKTVEPAKKVEPAKPAPAPKAETPKPAPAPVAEQPKKEEPKKEEPKAEAPKPAPAPVAEQPKKEEPKVVPPKVEQPKPEKKDSVQVKAPIVLDTAKTTNVEPNKPVAQNKSGMDPMYKALIISASFIVVGGVTALVFDMMAEDATSGTPKTVAEYKKGLDDAGTYQSVRDIGLGVLFTGVIGAGLSFCF